MMIEIFIGLLIGISNLFIPIPLAFFLFFISASIIKKAKHWELYLLLIITLVSLSLSPAFIIFALLGYLAGLFIRVSDKRLKRIIDFTFIGTCFYLLITLIIDSQIYELRSLSQLFSADLVFSRFPVVIITSTITAVFLLVIYLAVLFVLTLFKYMGRMFAFLFGGFVGMVIIYLVGMEILGIPWEDKWHWFDEIWWKSRVLLIGCLIGSIITGGLFVSFTNVIEKVNPKSLALFLAIFLTFLFEPKLHFSIRHGFWIHHPFLIPILIFMLAMGYRLSQQEAFREIYWKPRFNSNLVFVALYFFLYHAITEIFEVTSGWLATVPYGDIIISSGILTLPLGVVMAHIFEAIKDKDIPETSTSGNEYIRRHENMPSFYSDQRVISLNIEGVRLVERGQYDQAQELFEQAIELAPHWPEARIRLAYLLLRKELLTQAEAHLKEALKSKFIDSKLKQDALNNLASIKYSQKNFSEAIDLLKQATTVYQPDHEMYYNIGICYQHLGEWEKAFNYLGRSTQAHKTLKAQVALENVKQRMWQSKELAEISDSIKSLKIDYPECGKSFLKPGEVEIIEKNISETDSLVFFVGAGISYPKPSCIPMASQILQKLFHVIYEMDKDDICNALQIKTDKSGDEVYKQICRDLMNNGTESTANENQKGNNRNNSTNKNYTLPFEATFQALTDVFGLPVFRFVDLLEGDKPNIHHKMLAYALNDGHSVITTNFDQNIEKAFTTYFPNNSLKILISDKDFQNALDKDFKNGVLAKIHGDRDDYNSLALTMKGVAVRTDRTIFLGYDIDSEKGKRQYQEMYPRTTLSIPKSLFLQRILQERKMVVLGYSGSDKFDIMPVMKAQEIQSHGLWVEHCSGSVSQDIKEWRGKRNDRFVLQPKNKEEELLDITSKISKYFLKAFGTYWGEEENAITGKQNFGNSFYSWIDRLRIHPGDGLSVLAKLYSQQGKWSQAKLFYKKSMEKYQKNKDHCELHWLLTKSNYGYILSNLGNKDEALNLYKQIKTEIEYAKKERDYAPLYANTLLDVAGVWMNTDKDYEAGQLFQRAISLAKELDDKDTMLYGMRLTADRHMMKEEYQDALDYYLSIIETRTDVSADLQEACISSINAGICFLHLGQEASARSILSDAEKFAIHLGDKELIEAVEQAESAVNKKFRGETASFNLTEKSLENLKLEGISEELISKLKIIKNQEFTVKENFLDILKSTIGDEQTVKHGSLILRHAGKLTPIMQYYDELIKSAKKHVDDSREIDELFDYISSLQYDHAQKLMDDMLKKYNNPSVKGFLLFTKSNVYFRDGNPRKSIEFLKLFRAILTEDHPFIENNLGMSHFLLEEYDKAEHHLRKAIALMNGNYPLAVCNLGLVYANMRNLEAARKQLQRAENLKAPEFCLNELRGKISDISQN